MALVKFGGGIIEMRGAIAGTVFSRNKGGNYARSKTTPINPNTGLQQSVRAVMASLTDRWSQVLTANQRTAWGLYAASVTVLNRLGESVNISGFNHFIRSNATLLRCGLTVVDDGPTTFEIPAQDPTLSIVCDEAGQEIEVTYDYAMGWNIIDDGHMFVYMGSPQNPQINFFAGPWRYADKVDGATAVPPAAPAVMAAPFAMAEGQKIWCYARIVMPDGRLSEKFRAETFCTA